MEKKQEKRTGEEGTETRAPRGRAKDTAARCRVLASIAFVYTQMRLVKGIPPNTPNPRRAERRVMNHAETGESCAFLDDAEGI